MKVALLVLLLAFLASPRCASADASAHQMTAGDLAMFCKSTDAEVHNACKFFILGVFDTIGVIDGVYFDGKKFIETPKSKNFCFPDGVTSDKMEIFVRLRLAEELEFFPSDKDLPAVSVVVGMLANEYSCVRKTQQH